MKMVTFYAQTLILGLVVHLAAMVAGMPINWLIFACVYAIVGISVLATWAIMRTK